MDNKLDFTKQKPVVDGGSCAIFESEGKIYFINYRTNWLIILQFVLVILLCIVLINSAVMLILAPIGGVILAIFAIFLSLFTFWIHKLFKKKKNRDLKEWDVTGIVDLTNKTLADKDGQILAPLEQVKFKRVWYLFRWQGTTGSFYVGAEWPNGLVILAKPNPLRGGSADFFYYLSQKGFKSDTKIIFSSLLKDIVSFIERKSRMRNKNKE